MDSSDDRDFREDVLDPDQGETESSLQGSNGESAFRFKVTISGGSIQFSEITEAEGQIDDSVVEHLTLILDAFIGLTEQTQDNTTSPPASDAIIRALSKVKVEKDMVDEKNSVECPICMNSMPLGSHMTILPCSHYFYGDCIIRWLKEVSACPYCRKRIYPQYEREEEREIEAGQDEQDHVIWVVARSWVEDGRGCPL